MVSYSAQTFWARRGPGLLVKMSHGAGEKLESREAQELAWTSEQMAELGAVCGP